MEDTMNNKTKTIATLGIFTALYVVLSAFLKFTLFGNIMVDLGYIVFAFSLCMFGIYGTVVGVIGCALESILFTAYGFSISWTAANLVIGLICGFAFKRTRNYWIRLIAIFISVAIGMIVVKTAIECPLYGIPIEVKIPKNVVAFIADTIAMIVGLGIYKIFELRKIIT